MIYHYTNELPIIEISLYHAGYEISTSAVVDTGAMVSVLPYDLGMQLGFVWEEQTIPISLGGPCKGVPAFGVLVRGELAGLLPVALGFAWTRKTSQEVRTLLGYTNFFQHFKVTLEAYSNTFEIMARK